LDIQQEERAMLGRKKTTGLQRAVDTTKEVARKTGAAASAEMDTLLGTLAETVADARGSISKLSEEGAAEARKALDMVVKETRKGVKQLDKKWKKMDTKQKVAVVGGLLAVLAAAAATPTVVRKIRERKK
jgi:hypothetical protein